MVVADMEPTYRKYITPGIIVICLLIAVITENRSFIIGYSVSLIVWWLFMAHNRGVKIWQGLACVTGIVALIVLLTLYVKSDSTAGRMLIYKVSFAMFKEHWLMGIGWGNFKTQYLYYQADYFKARDYTTKELLLAGNTYFAFNDYWQLIIELGAIGILAILIICMSVLAIIRNALTIQTSRPWYVSFAISHIIALSIAACFTHVFEKEYMQILMILAIALLSFFTFFRAVSLHFRIACLALFCMGICHRSLSLYVLHYKQYKQWQEANELGRIGYLAQAKPIYASLYSDLKQYPLFLADYGNLLLATGEYTQAHSILSELIIEEPRNTYFADLGACYLAIDSIKRAEQAYQTAINMAPNRFAPRFALYKLYHNTGQQAKAKLCANEILNLPVKVSSAQITFILKQIKQELQAKR